MRCAIAEHELASLGSQIDETRATDEFLHSKYTNEQLYDWMVTQISTVYFQAYKLAFDMARRAELALQFELGRPDLSFVEFGYWDSLRKGLLSAERLGGDLRRMEAAYYESNTRELELTKHVSLAQFMPLQPPRAADLGSVQHPTPRVAVRHGLPGPLPAAYQVGLAHGAGGGRAVRRRARDAVAREKRRPPDRRGRRRLRRSRSPRAATRASPPTACPSSPWRPATRQNDPGLFELRFDDERYLPFEGAGAVSELKLMMPRTANAFDFSTISDVIVHVRYTASAGGPALTTAAQQHLDATLPDSGFRLFALRHEFGSEWSRLFTPPPDHDQTLTVVLTADQFPFYTRGRTINATAVDLFLEAPSPQDFEAEIALPGAALGGAPDPAPADPAYGNVPHLARTVTPPTAARGEWSIRIKTTAAAGFRSLTAADLSERLSRRPLLDRVSPDRALEAITGLIVRTYDPDAVILFGSVAQGRAGPHSDIDLLVIGPFTAPRSLRGRELTGLFDQYAMPVDVQYYTPGEFSSEARDPRSFAAMVQRHGTPLHRGMILKEKASDEFTTEANSGNQESFYAEIFLC